MAESLFDIFGEHLGRQTVKNASRQPLTTIENMGKTIQAGPIKPNEPVKKIGETKKSFLSNAGPIKPNEPVKKIGETKKSFLSNAGQALQSAPTPARKVFTPRAVNVGSLIYNDVDSNTEKDIDFEELEFTKPTYKYDNYHRDLLDYLPLSAPIVVKQPPPKTPPPVIGKHSMEFECSYEDDFFTDDFPNVSMADESDLNLPELY